MKYRKIAGGYLVRLDRGEEAMETLASFAAENKIPCGVLSGIGAVRNLELGYFDTRAGKYRRRQIRKTVEVVNLYGNISYLDKKPFIHIHMTVAGPDQKLLGGHFFRGTVAVTLEIHIRVIAKRLNRIHDPKIGFNFWDL
jgi:predicted DNA-binding protein with PD1-like motif